MEIVAELHPKVVHFPIAILIIYSIIEIIGIIFDKEFLQKTAHLLLAVGVITAIAAVLTGNQAGSIANDLKESGILIPGEVIEKHEDYGSITLWFFTALLVYRTFLVIKKKFNGTIRLIFIPLLLLGCFLIYKTADYGGELVYEYGVGTKLIGPKTELPGNGNDD